MNDNPPLPAVTSRHRQFLQFTLREILLLTIVVGLCLVIWRVTRTPEVQPTSFLQEFSIHPLLHEMRSMAALPSDLTTQTHMTGEFELNPSTKNRFTRFEKYLVRYKHKAESPAALLDRLQAYIETRLKEADCEIVAMSEALTGNPEAFVVTYRHTRIRGIANICAIHREREYEIVVLIHEYPDQEARVTPSPKN